MRRILIDERIENYANIYLQRMLDNGKPGNRIKDRLTVFYKSLLEDKSDWDNYAKYVDAVILHYNEIITLHPDSFDRYRNLFFSMLDVDDGSLSKKLNYHGHLKPFYEHLINVMGYPLVRQSIMLDFIKKMRIKTCVYCNSQYAITMDVNNNLEAMFDLDHVYPKSKYPFLCTSFYNLVPCCASCNRNKGNEKKGFMLYTNDKKNINPVKFSLPLDGKMEYFLTHQNKNIIPILEKSFHNSISDEEFLPMKQNVDAIYKVHEYIYRFIFW